MEPKSPVLTEEFVPNEVVYAKNQPEYLPLPVIRTDNGMILSRWTLSAEEREAIMLGADILLSVQTFNRGLPPTRLEVLVCDRDVMGVAERMGLLGSQEPQAPEGG